MTTRPISTLTHWRITHSISCEFGHRIGRTREMLYAIEADALAQHDRCIISKESCRLQRIIECDLRTPKHIPISENTDRWWLKFLHDRLVNVHKECPNIGYMQKLRGIIAEIPVDAQGCENDRISHRDIGSELDEEWNEPEHVTKW